ncbi:hypothetical protein RND81_12G027300 [Saponaria officinalis]|uniref:Cystatin domain-containing protein n=1 Tax=Saponaria officinalis TaxID=3572 RepID=A0AAW1H722_SAPOF
MQNQITFIFLITLYMITTNGEEQIGDPRTNIYSVKTNKEVQNVGKFAVDEYNLNLEQTPPRPKGAQGGALVFVAVVEAQKQVVAGWKYYLIIEAMQGGVTRKFDVEVLSQSWVHSKPMQLLKFIPSSE